MTYDELAKGIAKMTPAQRKCKVRALSECGNYTVEVSDDLTIDEEALGIYDCFRPSDKNKPIVILS